MELLVLHIVTHVLYSIPTVDTTDVRQYGTGAAMTKSRLSNSGVQVLVVLESRPNGVAWLPGILVWVLPWCGWRQGHQAL